jgi:arabinofuranosyltransferase
MLSRSGLVAYSVLVVAGTVFVWVALSFDFVQDDAYITFRYVANYLNGDGLVYNIGERVEGYTNFGWLLLLLVSGIAGLDYVLISRLAGVFFGAGAIFLTFFIARRCFNHRDRFWSLLPPVMLAANPSFAYWSQSGLETAAFVFLTALAVYLHLVRSWLLAAALVFIVLVRPEGALIAMLLVVAELLITRKRPKFTFGCAALALVFSLPFAGFKLLYYGSLLPNPFYAKTGLDLEQFRAGFEYAVTFLGHYPLLIVGLLLTPFFWRSLNSSSRTVWLLTFGFVVYVVVIGGDVLKAHRFFLPVAGLMAVPLAVWLSSVATCFRATIQHTILVTATVVAVALGCYLPHEFVYRYALLETALTDKMAFLAARLKETDHTDFSVAASTIGRLGYDLMGHRLIDLLGLTDSTIARHPEPAPAGMQSTWREQAFNSPYVLEQAPDYVVFSTGLKPSAPAERALLRYDQFLTCYRGASWYYQPSEVPSGAPLEPIFRKTREPMPPFEPAYPIEFVNSYNRGTNAYGAGNYQEADRCFTEALRLGGDQPYVYLLYYQAMTAFYLGEVERGEQLQNRILEIDSSVSDIQADLYVYEYTVGNFEKAAIHRRWLDSLSPWLVPRYDSIAVTRFRQWQMQQPSSR